MLAAAEGVAHDQALITCIEYQHLIAPKRAPSSSSTNKRTAAATNLTKVSNKRKFSDEQIKSLESIFENESKLQPRKKVQVARELGLQPRQVAIWFQNKRARWKSKQLEIDYGILRASYSALASRFDCLKKEKQSLVAQLEKLKAKGKNQQGGGRSRTDMACESNIINSDRESQSNNTDRSSEEEEEIKLWMRLYKDNYNKHAGTANIAMVSDDGCRDINVQETNYFGMDEEMGLLTMVEPACSSLTSDEEWNSLQSDGLFGQSPSSCEWWDFWS